jgi:hypothetical protein
MSRLPGGPGIGVTQASPSFGEASSVEGASFEQRADGNLTRMPTDIGIDEARRLVREDDALLLEVLPREEYVQEHLPGADNIPLKELTSEAVHRIDHDRPVIVYCDDDL